jgi:hypothetical protein
VKIEDIAKWIFALLLGMNVQSMLTTELRLTKNAETFLSGYYDHWELTRRAHDKTKAKADCRRKGGEETPSA